MSDFNHNKEDFSDNFNLKETIYPYLFKWKWYLVTLAIGVIFGLLYFITKVLSFHENLVLRNGRRRKTKEVKRDKA
jgi:hypothetical protein